MDIYKSKKNVFYSSENEKLILDDTFAAAMNKYGALFSLINAMATDVHEGFYHIIEGVVVVVVEHEFAPLVAESGKFEFFLCL